MANETGRTAERVARESHGRLVAYLSARTRDVAGAEDALAEAFASALASWPRDGVPEQPEAWLLTVARRRQTDAQRRYRTRVLGDEHVRLMREEIEAAAAEPAAIPDRRLALMFACAHPAIERGMRAPLILQTILGLTASEIAAAFLITPATMGQRLVRAKSRLRDAGIPFSVPASDQLPERLDAVLEAIYAAYGKGWADIGDPGLPALADEALWLGRLTVSLLQDEPEARGMLALMLYAEARRPARRDAAGRYVPLDRQDTRRWDQRLIAAAETLLHEASAGGPTGRYQIEAAIQSAHVARLTYGVANWPAIVALYDHLVALTGSPVARLNRAAAVANVDGPEAALEAMAGLEQDRRMLSYQPYWATKAHLAALAGRREEAHEAFTLVIGLATDATVRDYLLAQRDGLGR